MGLLKEHVIYINKQLDDQGKYFFSNILGLCAVQGDIIAKFLNDGDVSEMMKEYAKNDFKGIVSKGRKPIC